MSLDNVFVVPDHVFARRIGEEVVILNTESGTYFGLDPVGARAWDLITEGAPLKAVCEAMVDEYEVEPEQLERDITKLVQDLRDHGLLV